MTSLGEKIKSLREDKGYTQRELANLIGVNVSTVSRVEKDEITTLRNDAMLKLSELFDVSTNALISDKIETEKIVQTSFQKKLCDNYETADKKIQKAIRTLLDL